MTSIKGSKGPRKPLPSKLRARLALLAAQAWARELSSPEIALAFVNGELDRQLELPDGSDVDSLVAAVLAVGRERARLLDQLRSALNANQQAEALTVARELCNLPNGDGHNERSPQAVH